MFVFWLAWLSGLSVRCEGEISSNRFKSILKNYILLFSVFEMENVSAGTQAQLDEGNQSPLPLTFGSQHGAGGREWILLPQRCPVWLPNCKS